MKDTIFVRDLYNLTILGIKHELVYRTRTYERIEDPSPDKIRNIKANGYKIKTINKEGKTIYYFLKEVYLIPMEERKSRISAILTNEIPSGERLEDYLQQRWEDVHFYKPSDVELIDECSIIFEILASYFLGGHEGSDILDQKRWERIKQYEAISYNDDISDILELKVDKENRQTKPILKKKQEVNKHWSNTRCHRMNMIYSYGGCWAGRMTSIAPARVVERKGIIDKDMSYLAEWCYVSSNYHFEFNGHVYSVNSDKYNPLLGIKSMDKVLCYSQFGKEYFYDMDIFPVAVRMEA